MTNRSGNSGDNLMATLAADLPALRELTPRQRVLRRLRRRRGAMLGLGVVVFFVVLAVLAPTIAPHDPLQTSWSEVRKAPSAAHLFGTDEIGRDVTSRVIWGARASLLAGLVSVCISLSLGVPIGLLAGYVGGWVDAPDLAYHRCDACVPVSHPGHRAGGVPRSQPHQCDDRHRHLGDADLHPPDARAGALGQGRGLRRGCARGRQLALCASRCATSCPMSSRR